REGSALPGDHAQVAPGSYDRTHRSASDQLARGRHALLDAATAVDRRQLRSMSTLTASPVIERSTLLDGIRGFALMGIVGANFGVLSMWIFMSPEMQAALPGARFDPIIGFLHSVFIEGKFYSIFSLLFGIGFGIFLEKGTSAMKRYMRRMLILAVIGALHLRLIWEGDILLLYAMLVLLLPLFRKLRDRTLLVFACVLILLPVALDTITVFTDGAFFPAR